jgi:hypothetical protein
VTCRPLSGKASNLRHFRHLPLDKKGLPEEDMGSHGSMFALSGGPDTMMAHQAETDKARSLYPCVDALLDFVRQAAEQGRPAHEVERELWTQVLALGRQALGLFFALQGSGDLGDAVPLPGGRTAQRLEQTHARPYRSVFGDFTLHRTAYGSREGQKIEFVPLDARLQLPASDYSYVLQQWDQSLGCEFAFARVGATLFDVLGLKQSTDALERLNRQMAEHVGEFRQSRPLPHPEDEGPVLVAQADGKGVVMRRAADEPKIRGHRRKGQKANRKRMAVVGAIYSVGRCVRTAEDVLESLFREPREEPRPRAPRPAPVGKHLWASLSYEQGGEEVSGRDVVFGWLRDELARRNPSQGREVVYLMDGQESLWESRRAYLPLGSKAVEVLDLLHVTPRLWEAAHLFCQEGSEEAEAFVRERLLRVLQGRAIAVVSGLRQMGTKRQLQGARKKRLQTICGYLEKNNVRMRYDLYLASGYPIASGVIEGACRHYVKDRMERAGMHWTRAGAQAMLDVRSEYLNGDWEGFQKFRIERETERLYPHRQILDSVEWAMAA